MEHGRVTQQSGAAWSCAEHGSSFEKSYASDMGAIVGTVMIYGVSTHAMLSCRLKTTESS